jgi:PKD repeat protein
MASSRVSVVAASSDRPGKGVLRPGLAICVLSAVMLAAAGAMGDTIIDNRDSNTSSTGVWQASGATGYYGTDSVWSRDGATFTWSFTPADSGEYEVSMWWTAWSSRSNNIPVDIQSTAGTTRVYVNQLANGSAWNSLGKYTFLSGNTYKVTITSQANPTSTCADAVKFVYTGAGNMPPTATIDSISPSPAIQGEAVTLTGHGSDTDGTIAAYSWTSSIDGALGSSASFSASTLSVGVHTISFKVQDDLGVWSTAATSTLSVASNGTPADTIIDNRDAATSSTGIWQASGASGYYGSDSVWSRDGATFTWTFTAPQTGEYEVSMWWAAYSSRSSSIPVDIAHDGGSSLVSVNQLVNGGKWNSLGKYTFLAGVSYRVTMTSQASPTSTCADAVKFAYVGAVNMAPTATIDSITPSPALVGDTITFAGHGSDSDGTVAAYSWTSSINGALSTQASFSTSTLSLGLHTITFRVQDNQGTWSTSATTTLLVNSAQVPAETIIDNKDSATSKTGSWQVSGATGYYGADSVWSRDGATFTWNFKAPGSGQFEVMMWWTAWSSRSNHIPVDIQNASGTTRVYVNQLVNGAMWNSLGTYNFVAGATYKITITSQPNPTSTCADAVKFIYIPSNVVPVATIDYIIPSQIVAGQTVYFTGHGSDADGAVIAYSWTSSIDGALGSTESISTAGLSIGQHTITFMVQDDKGAWSSPVTSTVTVSAAPTDRIIDNKDSTTSSTGTWQVSGATGYYGADAVWSRDGATFTWIFTPTVSGEYDLSMWWSQYTSRSTSIPVAIQSSTGTSTVTINQKTNGGKWNLLGRYAFAAGTAYRITITSQKDPTSTCADAVKFVYVGPTNIAPAAEISDITPDPAMPGDTIKLEGKASDSDGLVTAYSWRSSIDGYLGNTSALNVSTLSRGTHTIYFKAQDNNGAWSAESSGTLGVGVEHIYISFGYGGQTQDKSLFAAMLIDLGATGSGNEWQYIDTAKNKTYMIHFIESLDGVAAPMTTFGAHVIINAHSNYGLGLVFANSSEKANLMITDIKYIDDDRILNIGTPWVSVSPSGMRTGQAYPYWWPVFKDGTSGLMPYVFGDPNGDPAYNYYPTYRVAGDSTYYKIESTRNSALQRYFDCGKPAWYSETGGVPNPNDPNHQKYYITNSASWSPSFLSSGPWVQDQVAPALVYSAEYFKENYFYTTAGTGTTWAKWLFTIPASGKYVVSAWWPSSTSNTTAATYAVTSRDGSTPVTVNQTTNGRRWNSLGTFSFNAGSYSVLLTNNAPSGRVIADGIRIEHENNPPAPIQADFYASVRSGPAPLQVSFSNASAGDYTGRTWTISNGFSNSTRDDLDYQFITPGVYSVTLTVTGPTGSDTKTKTSYINVWSTTGTAPLQAEFRASNKLGTSPLTVSFRDLSTGNLTDPNIAWTWDFGDGQTSHLQNPTHTYTALANYTVKLTVNDGTSTATETKANLVRVIVFDKSIDNVDYPKRHYGSKNMVYTKGVELPKDQFRYYRLLYASCNSGNYYTSLFNRKTFFYTVTTSGEDGSVAYLQAYLQGKSNQEIWEAMQAVDPSFDYYNFDLKPGTPQQATVTQSLLTSATPVASTSTVAATSIAAATSSGTVAAAAAAPTAEQKNQNLRRKAMVSLMKSMNTSAAFERLKGDDFLASDSQLAQAISQVYGKSKDKAIGIALAKINTPATTVVEGKTIKSTRDFRIAKKILEQFPEDASGRLLGMYSTGSVSTKANVILASGGLAGRPEIYAMLVKALDDKTATLDADPDTASNPMRICDLAYNQLALKLRMPDILRVIRPDESVAERDYHINILKERLQTVQGAK